MSSCASPPATPDRATMTPGSPLSRFVHALPLLLCIAAVVAHWALIDLKGISTDEGFRLGIMNGGRPAQTHPAPPWATWDEVIATVSPHAYQPGYYLIQNSFMRLTGRQDILIFRELNLGFFALCLLALLGLSRDWSPWPRSFLIGLFAFNAYLIMHVLQVREYIVAVALYLGGTGLVLHLDQRQLGREWRDVAWFTSYGLLMAFGFYLQTWTVFPAIAQGAFLVLRRRPQLGRFLAHLALSYLVVFALTWPYLQANRQKVDVGLWAQEQVTLLGQLKQGFQLVLSGHLPGHAWFTSALPVAWLALLVAGAWVGWRKRAALPPGFATECGRQTWLMVLSILLPLAFQVAYFYQVEPLSVWPRYFIIHYFFLTWLVALAFRSLHAARNLPGSRHATRVGLGAASVILAASSVYQIHSFRADPYLDTSLSPSSDWRVGTHLLARELQPDDVLVSQDFVTRSTLSFTRPVDNRIIHFADVETAPLDGVRRLLYLEPVHAQFSRAELAAKAAARGYGPPVVLATSPAVSPETEGYWRLVAFQRP